ncbi:4144_t:CDS:2 [Funneliformis geosporum]|nr:4144_t:CDS:2 [Funneliformis geosporum]
MNIPSLLVFEKYDENAVIEFLGKYQPRYTEFYEKFKEQVVIGDNFMCLTENCLKKDPFNFPVRAIMTIIKQDQVNDEIDELLIQAFDKFNVKEIAPETHEGYSESKLKELCERKIFYRTGRLYYKRKFGSQADYKIVSCLCRIEEVCNDGLSVIIHINNKKRLSPKCDSL